MRLCVCERAFLPCRGCGQHAERGLPEPFCEKWIDAVGKSRTVVDAMKEIVGAKPLLQCVTEVREGLKMFALESDAHAIDSLPKAHGLGQWLLSGSGIRLKNQAALDGVLFLATNFVAAGAGITKDV